MVLVASITCLSLFSWRYSELPTSTPRECIASVFMRREVCRADTRHLHSQHSQSTVSCLLLTSSQPDHVQGQATPVSHCQPDCGMTSLGYLSGNMYFFKHILKRKPWMETTNITDLNYIVIYRCELTPSLNCLLPRPRNN